MEINFWLGYSGFEDFGYLSHCPGWCDQQKQLMNKLIAIVLTALLFLNVDALSHRRPRDYINKRNRDRIQLKRTLSGIVTNSTELVKKAENIAIQHMVIKGARENMFSIYDGYLDGHCREESEMDDKKKIVKGAWKIVTDYLFKLDRIDMHNGCFTSGIEFPSVIYD